MSALPLLDRNFNHRPIAHARAHHLAHPPSIPPQMERLQWVELCQHADGDPHPASRVLRVGGHVSRSPIYALIGSLARSLKGPLDVCYVVLPTLQTQLGSMLKAVGGRSSASVARRYRSLWVPLGVSS